MAAPRASGPVQWVYVGGVSGDFPSIVATSVERAMLYLIELCTTGDDAYEQAWSCRMVDGDPDLMEWTTTVIDHGDSLELYVKKMDVDTDPGSL